MAGKKGVKKNREGNQTLFYFAVALLLLSLIIFSVNVMKVMQITGKATQAYVNITIPGLTQINWTTGTVEFGTGSVSSGGANATLDTSSQGVANLTGGNWSGNTAGLVLENIGNQNVSIDLASLYTGAGAFLNGTNPVYQWNVTNLEVGSCTPGNGITLAADFNANKTLRLCSKLLFQDTNDSIRLDIRLVVPSDSFTLTRTDTISATATAV